MSNNELLGTVGGELIKRSAFVMKAEQNPQNVVVPIRDLSYHKA